MSADLVIALLKILRSSRTAGLEKLRCSARRLCERQVWAVRVYGIALDITGCCAASNDCKEPIVLKNSKI